MTTATVNRAPTEAEIREAIEKRSTADPGQVVYDLLAPMESLWADLRPSEEARLSALMEPVFDLAEKLERQLLDAVVAAGLTFAAEYPDAPRAVPEVSGTREATVMNIVVDHTEVSAG